MEISANTKLVDMSFKGLAYFVPVLLILIPLSLFLLQSFFRVEGNVLVRNLTFDNYQRFFTDPIFMRVLMNSCLLSLTVAVLTVFVAYPIVIFLISIPGKFKYPAVLVFVIPLLLSYILKIYAIRSILGGNGFLNKLLLYVNVIDRPITFLIFNLYSVAITLTLILLPFTMLPLFVVIEKIPKQILDASYDLGATNWQTFWKVIFPLSLPGAVTGLSFTFVLALGDFVTPQMVGGMNGLTFGRLVYSQFGFAYNWPFGSALSIVLLAVVSAALLLGTWLANMGKRHA